MVLTVRDRASQVGARMRALPDMELLAIDEDASDDGERSPRVDATDLLSLAVRFDLASVYRRLTGEA
ncbi:hypothetical protein GCM10009551_086060 [Nocardiopsis tropica]